MAIDVDDASGAPDDEARPPQAVDGGSSSHDVLPARPARRRGRFRLLGRGSRDRLTGLPDRAALRERLARALRAGGTANGDGRPAAALILVDLDRFQAVNDSLGEAVGDQLLVGVADRLRRVGGGHVARVGGDEFAVLLEEAGGLQGGVDAAQAILEALRAPFDIDGREVFAGASVGVAVAEPGLGEPERLLRDADVALHRAKTRGRGRYEVFDPLVHGHALHRLELEADLRRALERGELVLFYQPVVELEDERIVGVEALLRWKHPEGGVVQPGEFLPAAEDTGLIHEIGRWVATTACERALRWQRDYPLDPPLQVSVNLSAVELQAERVVDDIARASWQAGMAPSNLVVEISEALMMRAAPAVAKLRELKELGVKLAVDDVAVGYALLSRLRGLPLDWLKVDRSFVEDIDRAAEDEDSLAVAILKLGRLLDLEIVAEGIERESQLHVLRDLGCHMGQGYLFARPVDELTMTALLDQAAARGRLGRRPPGENQGTAFEGQPLGGGIRDEPISARDRRRLRGRSAG